jgi:hypothetical protein
VLALIFIDAAFYTILYAQKDKYYKKEIVPTKTLSPCQSKGISAEKIIFSNSKYLVACFIILIVWTGEFQYLLNFITSRPSFIYKLLKLSCFYFFQQYFIYHCLITYEAHVFFSILSTIGLYEKIYDYLFRFWNVNSLIAIALAIALFRLISEVVATKKKTRN